MDSSSLIEFEASSPPYFVGRELALSERLVIFGSDLPEFRKWAYRNGVSQISQIKGMARYLAGDHDTVVHDFGLQISLTRIEQISARIRPLMSKAARLVLFLNLSDYCTIEDVRQVLRVEFPDLTFRVVYPRGIYKSIGTKVVLVERRKPRVFLFLSSRPMAGKTESALSFFGTETIVVHGDEYYHALLEREASTGQSLSQSVTRLTNEPFNRALFAEFIAQIPAFKAGTDLVFDFFMPNHAHLDVAEFFDSLGFFPVLCLLPADQKSLIAQTETHQAALAAELDTYQRALAAQHDAHQSALAVQQDAHQRAMAEQQDVLQKALAEQQDVHQKALTAQQDVHRRALAAQLHVHENALIEQQTLRQKALAAQQHVHQQALAAQQQTFLDSTCWTVTAPLRFLRRLWQSWLRSARSTP